MRGKFRRVDKGQIVVWVALALPLLVLFTALAVDMTLIYMNKGRLANAVDSAVLTGVRNYGNGSAQQIAQAQTLATDMFEANYGSTAPALTFEWCPNASDPNCGQSVALTVHAEAAQNTAFMKVLPSLATWQLGDTATATRSNLVMTIILDRSGSMCGGSNSCDPGVNGDDGGQALQAAVPAFVADFDNGVDHVALVSFSSNSTADVAMTTNFQSAIGQAVAGYSFRGGTFGGGAGTNSCTGTCQTTDGPPLNMADYQNSTVPVEPGYPITKVVVYFTDGLMNTIQDSFHCGGTNNQTLTLLNYGGQDPPAPYGCPGGYILDPTQAENIFSCAQPSFQYDNNPTHTCKDANGQNVTTFPSQQSGTQVTFAQTAITSETKYRALYTANQMRSESPVPTYFFVIGLGSEISGDETTEAFLSSIANDPNGPANYPGATYSSSLAAGEFLIVPDCPSSVCTQELTQAFQAIATKILLRLSQ